MRLRRHRGLSDAKRARVPPAQHVVRDFPVLHVGAVPYDRPLPDWDLRVEGEVEAPLRVDAREWRALPRAQVTCDIHCVTSWSKLDTSWEGVSARWLLAQAHPSARAAHVIAHAEEGYSASLPLEALRGPQVLLADRYDGRSLAPAHGGPLRLLVPQLYFWKSVKWLRTLELRTDDAPGYWERYGYSNSADPWREERYAF